MIKEWYIRDEAIRKRLITAIEGAPLGTYVKLYDEEQPRSVHQNATYWMWISDFIKSGEIKDADGNKYTKNQMHYELGDAFLEPVEWTNRKGKKRYTVPSTKDLSVGDFSVYLNKIKELSHKMGVHLRDPAYYGLEK